MPPYQEYRDIEVNLILIDDQLSNQEKLLQIKNRYKTRLLSSGKDPQAIPFYEKEIREEILYEQKRIETAFRNLTFSYNEANVSMAMGKVHIMQDALASALAEIATNITVNNIPIRDHHEINEAKKTGREVDEIKGIHADQLKKAQEFHDEAKSWGRLIWGGFILLIVGAYVYMYSPLIIQAIHGIGESGTDEARRTQNVASVIVYGFGGVLILGGLGVIYQAGIQSLVYPFELMRWIVKWGSLKNSLRKTQSYNGEAKALARQALLWAISPTFLFLGIAAYYIIQPFQPSAPTQPKTIVVSSFKPNALTNRNEPIRDTNNATANVIESLAKDTPIFILHPELVGQRNIRWFEVQTQNGKTGWIDGWGFRLASNDEIASFASSSNTNVPGTVSNANTANNLPSSNGNQSSNSSEVATATPYSNPLVEQTPRPIENPDTVYRDFKANLIKSTKNDTPNQLYNLVPYTETNPFDFDAMQTRYSDIDSPLKSIIFNGDEEILAELNSCTGSYHEALRGEIFNVDQEYSYIANNKYGKIGMEGVSRDAPETGEYLTRGLNIFKRRIPQFIQTLKTVSNAGSRIDKIKLLGQCREQFNKQVQTYKDASAEMSLRQRERGK